MGNFYLQSTDPHGAHTPQNDRKQKIPRMDSTKEWFIFVFILFYGETETTEYVYTSQVKTTAGKKKWAHF